jgi:hypothetical protein
VLAVQAEFSVCSNSSYLGERSNVRPFITWKFWFSTRRSSLIATCAWPWTSRISIPWITSGHGYRGLPYPSTSSDGGQTPYSSTSGHGESSKGESAGGNGGTASGSSPRSTDQLSGTASSDEFCVICLNDTIINPKSFPAGTCSARRAFTSSLSISTSVPRVAS